VSRKPLLMTEWVAFVIPTNEGKRAGISVEDAVAYFEQRAAILIDRNAHV